MSDKTPVGERQEVPVTCQCDTERGWELHGVCEGNGDGGVGANHG